MHTQGPWKYDINPNAPEAIIVDCEGYTVVELSAMENTTCASDLEANARLIAAAPDLLQAIYTARKLLLDVGVLSFDAYQQIDAAIAKAKGVQS